MTLGRYPSIIALLFIGELGMTNVLFEDTADKADIGVGALDIEGVTTDAVGTGGGLVE